MNMTPPQIIDAGYATDEHQSVQSWKITLDSV